MNRFDPEHRFSGDAIRNHGGSLADGAADSTRQLGEMAFQAAEYYRRDTLSPALLSGIFRIVEFILVVLAGIAVYGLYVGFGTHMARAYPLVVATGSLMTIVFLEFGGNYRMSVLREPLPRIHRILLAWCAVFALLATAGFLLKISEDFSRVWFAGWMASGFAAMLILRLATARLIRRWARNGTMERRAVIIGGGAAAEALIRAVERQPANDIRICGIFDDRDDVRSPPIVAGYPKLGTVAELLEFARIAHIDLMIVVLPITAGARVLSLLKKIWVLPVDIRLSAHSNRLQFQRRAYSFIGSVPMLDIFDKPIGDWDSVAKRLFDIVFSLLGILVFSPVMLATAIAIKLDSRGPVLFRQKRHGFNNEVIEVFKFRSMYIDQCDPTARNAVGRDDPRVTRVGRFIRKTSIDELPQFFNALLGSLSLVGPRPHAVSAQTHDRVYHEVVDGYFARHKVKPGVTGWAQINGWRGEMDSDEKIRMRTQFDLDYIENWSLWLDMKILFLTPVRLLNTENAY